MSGYAYVAFVSAVGVVDVGAAAILLITRTRWTGITEIAPGAVQIASICAQRGWRGRGPGGKSDSSCWRRHHSRESR